MDLEVFARIERSDIIRPRQEARSFLVSSRDAERIIAVDTMTVSNPAEWCFGTSTPIGLIASLVPGACVNQLHGGPVYVITSVHDSFAIAVRTVVIHVTEAGEWVLSRKAVLVPQTAY